MTAAASARRYMIDTCSLTALRHTYPKKLFPGAWALVDSLAADGRLLSIEEVAIELAAFDDEVSTAVRRGAGIRARHSGDVSNPN